MLVGVINPLPNHAGLFDIPVVKVPLGTVPLTVSVLAPPLLQNEPIGAMLGIARLADVMVTVLVIGQLTIAGVTVNEYINVLMVPKAVVGLNATAISLLPGAIARLGAQ
jgi:hypothetical protein